MAQNSPGLQPAKSDQVALPFHCGAASQIMSFSKVKAFQFLGRIVLDFRSG